MVITVDSLETHLVYMDERGFNRGLIRNWKSWVLGHFCITLPQLNQTYFLNLEMKLRVLKAIKRMGAEGSTTPILTRPLFTVPHVSPSL